MRLSVVILNYNVRHFLHLCLQSVIKATAHIDAEVIVVDNNSSDDSCQMMKTCFPDITLIENNKNLGFPKGNNIGVADAKGDYICILNPDTVVAEDTFEKILEFVSKTPNAGVTGIKLIDGRGGFLPESKRGVPTPWVAFTKISGLYKMFPNIKSFNHYYNIAINENGIGTTDTLVGAFMFMERSLYLSAGGFDEDCFMYSDDIDLSYTISKKGFNNYYFGQAAVIHYKGESTVKDGTYMRRFREAMQFFYKKHFKAYRVFDVFMRVGSFAFMFVKKNKKGKAIVPECYILVSASQQLADTLQQKVEKPVISVSGLNEDNVFLQYNDAEIVFDAGSVSYKDIITFMDRHQNAFTYKIKPFGADFIIGSNNSDDRGTIINLF